MSSLSDAQKAKLEVLWRRMPDAMRTALRASAAASAGGDPASAALVEVFDELTKACREPAGDKAKGYLFEPLRLLIGDPDDVAPTRARFTAKGVATLWAWLAKDVAPKLVAEAKDCREPATHEIWHDFRLRLGEALDKALAKADRVPKDMTALTKRFDKGGREWLGDAAVLMRRSRELEEALVGVSESVEDLSENLVDNIHKRYEAMTEEAPNGALWLLIVLLARLESPWQIFRMIERIGKRGDDLVVSKTDIAVLGDSVLADTGFYASRLKMPPANLDEARDVLGTLERYVSYSTGMTREFGIRKDGRWGRSLFSLRAEASSNLEKIFEKASPFMKSGLPEPIKGRNGRVIPAQPPEDAAVDRCEAMLFLLAGSREYADAAAVGSLRKKIHEDCLQRLEEAGAALVDLVADSEGQARTTSETGLEITARLMDAAGESDSASVLRRRGAAASNAA
jgi:hypothetical protein